MEGVCSMPIYNRGEILLSHDETDAFLKRLQNPDTDLLSKREAFLDEIRDTIRVKKLDDGVLVDVDDAPAPEQITITSENIYFTVPVTIKNGMHVSACMVFSGSHCFEASLATKERVRYTCQKNRGWNERRIVA